MEGMTLRQAAKRRFYQLCEAYKEAKKHMETEDGRHAFIVLSVQIHTAKAHVPKRLWPLVNKA